MKFPNFKLSIINLPIIKEFNNSIEAFENDLIERIKRLPPKEREKMLFGAMTKFVTKKHPTSSNEDK